MSDAETVPDDQPAKVTKSSMLGASAMKTHLTLVFGLALCTVAFWFELRRAEGGNELSWAYVFEWPLLGIFAIYMWWKLLHPGFTLRRAHDRPAVAPQFKGMLQAWQAEVQKLENDRRADEAEGATQSGDAATLDSE